MTEPSIAATAAPAKSASLWEDFIDVLYAPVRVFERRRGRGFGGPLVLLALLFGIVTAATMSLTRPLLDRQMDLQIQQMRKNGMSDEQIAGARGTMERIGSITAVAGPTIGILVVVPIAALVLWGIGRAFGGAFDYSAAGVISTYSLVPSIVTAVLGAVLLLFIDAQSLPLLQAMTVGPVLFLDRDASPVLVAVLTRFGIAEIWGFIITVAGLQVLAKLPRNTALGAAAANWALGTIVAVLFGLRAAASMGG
jgi:hypothetical protein